MHRLVISLRFRRLLLNWLQEMVVHLRKKVVQSRKDSDLPVVCSIRDTWHCAREEKPERRCTLFFAVFLGSHMCFRSHKMPGHSVFSDFILILVDAILFWLDHRFLLVDHHFLHPFQQKSLKNEVKSPIFACLLTRCTICLFKVHSSENHQKNN